MGRPAAEEQAGPALKRKAPPGSEGVPAAEVLTFHLLKKDGEGQVIVEEDGHFPPEMTHQLFGQEEEIVGYDGLSVDVWMTPRFQTLVDVKYAAKAPGATDLRAAFTAAFPAGFFEAKPHFDAALLEEAPLDVGVLGEQVAEEKTDDGTQFLVLHSQLATAHPDLKALHARMEPLLLFFVDAASGIDPEDSCWDLLLAVEQSPEGVEVLGYATLYRYWHYPEGHRLRLSQMLVLPPHQGRGVGSLLLAQLYKLADERGAHDITFEDPTEQLQRLRDKADLARMLRCEWLREEAGKALAAAAGSGTSGKGKEPLAENGQQGRAPVGALAAPPATLERLRVELRLCRQQARRMWEALLFLLSSQQGGGGAQEEALRGAIQARIQQQVAAAKKDAAGKAVRDTDSGFVMSRAGRSGGTAQRPAVPNVAVEGVSAEQQQEAIEEAVDARVGEIHALLESVAVSAAGH